VQRLRCDEIRRVRDTLKAWLGVSVLQVLPRYFDRRYAISTSLGPQASRVLSTDGQSSKEIAMPVGGSKPGEHRGGRKKGTPNKATTDMREALARLAEANIPKLQKWLNAVKDPAKRFSLFLDLCEYHLPRLARTELTGLDGAALEVRIVRFSDTTSEPVDSSALSAASVEGSGTGLPPRRTLPSPSRGQG